MTIIAEDIKQVHYIKGQDNIVADALFRNINNINIQNNDLNKIAKMQQHDRELDHHKKRTQRIHFKLTK